MPFEHLSSRVILSHNSAYGETADGQQFSYTVGITHPEIISSVVLHAGCMDNGIYIYVDGSQVFYTYMPEDSNYCDHEQNVDITSNVINKSSITVSGYHIVKRKGGGNFYITVNYK